MSQEMDPRASSGKFLRVKSRYPESFTFLGLCSDVAKIVGMQSLPQRYGGDQIKLSFVRLNLKDGGLCVA